MAQLRARILGCGSSGGVPRLGAAGGHWGACDPDEPRNRRSRCSLLLTKVTEAGETTVLIDTSPDMRAQLLAANVTTLDGVIWTHPHADHVHGIDDLRMLAIGRQSRLPGWADAPTTEQLHARFGYIFETPAGSSYPPLVDLAPLDGPVTVEGAGGPLTLDSVLLQHGDIPARGILCGGLAYLPDVNAIPDAAWARLQGLEVLIVDALRRSPHPSHAHLDQALEWIAAAAPERAVLTNMHTDLDYHTLEAETPAHITPAFDGLELELPLP
ncbi:MBL fold metallo-hydrolase [Pseudoroseicyclus aestuarii]|nr:MBL fold metallo-hydrolase [Pseudoroseicyclus aestuarii]